MLLNTSILDGVTHHHFVSSKATNDLHEFGEPLPVGLSVVYRLLRDRQYSWRTCHELPCLFSNTSLPNGGLPLRRRHLGAVRAVRDRERRFVVAAGRGLRSGVVDRGCLCLAVAALAAGGWTSAGRFAVGNASLTPESEGATPPAARRALPLRSVVFSFLPALSLLAPPSPPVRSTPSRVSSDAGASSDVEFRS